MNLKGLRLPNDDVDSLPQGILAKCREGKPMKIIK